jgi:hypothetical protein
LYIIKDGTIIHELNKEEMQKEKEEDVVTKAISSQKFDALIDKEQMLNELLELQNMLKEKINKLKS